MLGKRSRSRNFWENVFVNVVCLYILQFSCANEVGNAVRGCVHEFE